MDGCNGASLFKPELELIQAHMTQGPLLRVEVGARALRVRSVLREDAWAHVHSTSAALCCWGKPATHTQPALRTGLMALAWRPSLCIFREQFLT